MRKILIILFIFLSLIGSGQSARRLLLAIASTPVGSLISCYPLNNVTAAYDCEGTNDGTNNGATVVTGKVGDAYDFDGSTDYVDLGDDLSSSSTGSISLWFKSGSLQLSKPVFSTTDADGSTNNIVSIQLRDDDSDSNNEVSVVVRIGGTTTCNIYAATNIVVGTWYHVVATSDGSSKKIYINGVNQSLTIQTGTNNADWWDDVTETCEWDMASRSYDSRDVYYDGIIDEAKIYDYALSQAEVTAEYNSGSGVACDCGSSIPDFAGVSYISGVYYPCLIRRDGGVILPGSHPTIGIPHVYNIHYDKTNKLLVYGSTVAGEVYAFDFNDIALSTYKTVDLPGTGIFRHLSYVNTYWMVSTYGNINAYYTNSSAYVDFTAIGASIFGGTVPTGGIVNGVSFNENLNDYYYGTDDGEIGRIFALGATTASQRLDILTYDVTAATAGDKVIAFSTEYDRWALPSDSEAGFLSNTHTPTNIINVVQFDADVVLGIEVGTRDIYRIDFITFPVDQFPYTTNINPSGYNIHDINVDGSTVYVAAQKNSDYTWWILKTTTITSGTPTWGVHVQLDYPLYRLFKY